MLKVHDHQYACIKKKKEKKKNKHGQTVKNWERKSLLRMICHFEEFPVKQTKKIISNGRGKDSVKKFVYVATITRAMATRGSGSHSNHNLRPQGSQPQRENPGKEVENYDVIKRARRYF